MMSISMEANALHAVIEEDDEQAREALADASLQELKELNRSLFRLSDLVDDLIEERAS